MVKRIICIVLFFMLQGCWENENGVKVGNIVKLTHDGAIIKTWEAELIRGGMNNGSGAFGKPFYFTIENTKHLSIIKESIDNQYQVKISYHHEFTSFPFRSASNDYYLDDIKLMKLNK